MKAGGSGVPKVAEVSSPSPLRPLRGAVGQAERDSAPRSSGNGAIQLQGEVVRARQRIAGMEREISDLRKTLRLVVDKVPDCVEVIDGEFRVLLANQASAGRWRRELGESDSRRCYRLRYEIDEPCADCPAERALRTGLPVSVVREETGEDGRSARWQVTSYPLKDEHGRVIRIVNFAANLTRKRWREALGLQAVRLSAVGELAAGIAHEVNNPLTAIIGNAQLLLREFDASDPAWAPLHNIERAGLRATAVVETLLAFSHQGEYSFALANVNDTILDSLDMVSAQFRRDGVEIDVSLADDLPPIMVSRPHLQTTWLNLLINAREAVQDCTPAEIRIGTERSENGQWVRVYVSDNGRGIPAENVDRVFEPFFTTKQPNQGTGLGLFICHEIVTRHKGRIEVDSQPGEGSTFRVSLPVE